MKPHSLHANENEIIHDASPAIVAYVILDTVELVHSYVL